MPKLTVEKFLSSTVAVAVLQTLIRRDMPLPISRLAKEVGSNYITVRKHLKLLEDADLVTRVNYGKRTLYKTNSANERISLLKTFIESWDRLGEK